MHASTYANSMNHTKCKSKRKLSPELLERMAGALRVLAHAHRLQIVDILDRNGTAPVHRIVEELDLPQATVSHCSPEPAGDQGG